MERLETNIAVLTGEVTGELNCPLTEEAATEMQLI